MNPQENQNQDTTQTQPEMQAPVQEQQQPAPAPTAPLAPPQTAQSVSPAPVAVNNGSAFSIAGIVMAVCSLIVLPILFMPLGIVFGSIGIKKGDKIKGMVAIILSIVLGLISIALGAYFYTLKNSKL